MNEKTVPAREDIDNSYKWDLTELLDSDEEWQALLEDMENEISGYNKYRGRLHESVELFKEAIDFDLSISRKLDIIYTYAHLKSDEDKSNQNYLAMYQRAIDLYMKASELSSFLTPEIQSIPDKKTARFMQNHILKEYKFYLEKIIRYKPHTLSKEMEKILAMSGQMAQAPSEIFSQLDNADLKFGMIENEKGELVELSHGNFNTFLMNPRREIRKKAFFQYYKVYDQHKHTISTALAYSNKKDHFYSRVRNFTSCRESALFPDNVEEEVYDNLIKAVIKNRAPLFKYLNFRKNALKLEDLHFYDTYVPIIKDIDFKMTYEEAVDISIKALLPLGKEYVSILKEGLLGGWVDRFENRGKRSGAYSSGCYDSPPYILINYDENNINSLYTLIHEAGHSMHTYYSNNAQPYMYHQYTIFVAEVASTFNETLLSNYLLEYYKNDPSMLAYILNREIDNIRGTLFRQVMFAEFEKITHDSVENNMPLTLEFLRGEYKKLLGKYFGNTIVIDDVLSLEFLRIPHFYSSFYVYKYATGISAAITLANKVLKEGASARGAYIDFLKLGASLYPIDQLQKAGVDMRTPFPVENAIEHFSELVERFIEICGKISE